jgi:hypothetical protein
VNPGKDVSVSSKLIVGLRRGRPRVSLALSLCLHALSYALAAGPLSERKPDRTADDPVIVPLRLMPPRNVAGRPE